MPSELWALADTLAIEVQQLGNRHGLPFVAAQSDLGDPEPMRDAQGKSYAESCFRWMDDGRYWDNRRLALDSIVLNAARLMADPFAFYGGKLHSWRPAHALDAFDCDQVTPDTGVAGSIVAPVHLPGGRLGAVVWATTDAAINVAQVYADHAIEMHGAAIRLIATHAEASTRRQVPGNPHLTRREVQCLRWAGQGKTDVEIGMILELSVSTVRFHLRNAAEKLGTTGRTQTIRQAAGFGFIGARGT